MKILFLQVSGLHLGYIGCYGNDWISTPALDRLAAESVVFDQHYADCLSQWPSAWTGLCRFPWLPGEQFPTPSSLEDILPAHGVPVIRITEAQLLAASHINPASYHGEIRQSLQAAMAGLAGKESWLIGLELPSLLPPWLVGEDYLLHYFQPDEPGEPADDADEMEKDTEDEEEDIFEEEEEDESESAEENPEVDEDSDEIQEADEEEGDHDEVPGMLWPLLDPPLGLIDQEDSELLERLQLSYAAAVSQTDAYLQTALDELQEAGLQDDVLLIVTSDRGLALGEHGLVGDAKPWLHEELVHLPLLMRMPGMQQAGRRIPALTQPVDLFPTILEVLDITAPENHGHSLLPLVRGAISKIRAHACTGLKIDEDAEWLLRTPEWAVLLPDEENGARRLQIFAKPEDRWEVNNLRQHNLDLTEQLEQTLREWAKGTAQGGKLQAPALPAARGLAEGER